MALVSDRSGILTVEDCKMTTTIDVDKGTLLGAWVCRKCGHRTVVRTKSKWVRPPKSASETCSCSGCCHAITDEPGTVSWYPALTEAQ